MSNIIIEDVEIPLINCANDTAFIFEDIDFNNNVSDWIGSTIGTDNCTAVTIENNYDVNTVLGNCEEESTQTIIFTIQDECGFTNDCMTNLTVRTSRTPIIICPRELIVECGIDNTANISNWINTGSGEDADGNNLTVTNDFIQNEFEALTCGDTLIVNFLVNDNCNFTSDCNSIIILEDTTPPAVNCDATLTVNSADSNSNSIIENWLDRFSADDMCGSAIGQNDFDLTAFDICSSATSITVTYTATDECGLTNSCQSTLEIIKDLPVIICPSDLIIECGLSDNQITSEITMLIEETTAIDNAGNNVQSISNDYINMSLVNDCQASVDINLTVSDNCGFSSQCVVNVSIEDTTPPELTCPNEIFIDIDDSNIQNQVENWLGSYNHIEVCNNATTTDDYSFDISTLECEIFIDVEFISIDECMNSSSCVSNITFVNNNSIEIICPDDISVTCSTFTESDLTDFLNGFNVESQDTFTTSNNYAPLNLSCLDVEIQTVTFEAIDICGQFNDCESTVTYTPAAKTYIPNTFSPNRDGDNDVFTVYSNEFVTNVNSLSIYDRWGELVFQNLNFPTNDESQGWDGNFNNQQAEQGIYLYVILTQDSKGNIKEEVGQLNLLR